ncbi:hypothetical protein M1446_02520 [Candidatus Dependentiae bacterium]|nr:hypothetical protein [Candidatus Dependentiae bacterium]
MMQIIFLFTLFIFSLTAYDVPLFYRAQPLFQEPRFEKPYLTTLDFTLSGGSTNCARNCAGKKVPLGNIFGIINIKNLALGIPNLNQSNPIDQILINLQNLPDNDCFGKLSINGHFEILELVFNGIQNFDKGFFSEFLLPIRRLEISNVNRTDLSPTDGEFPNKNTIEWQQFLGQFCPFFKHFNLNTGSFKEFFTGNITFFAGWTKNYEYTTHLDFVDTTLKVGLQLPTASDPRENHIFNLSTGYEGFGVPVVWQFSIGAYEWLTVGAQVDGLFLFNDIVPMRIKTDKNQSGLIKIFKDNVKIDQGTAWHIGTYLKADHIIRGFSFLLGYSYDRKEADRVIKTCSKIDPEIVNSDPSLQGWSMHTLHLNIEYDFESESNPHGPRIGFVYNRQLAGKNVFSTSLESGYIGTDLCWKF